MPVEQKRLKKIRESIVRSNELLSNNKLKLLDEETARSTNCYSYALGIMYRAKGKDFCIGFTENVIMYLEDPNEIVNKICIDLKNLNISFRKINLHENKDLRENEYLVKLFYTPPSENIKDGDIHFIRQDRKSGKWFHKLGWYNQPEFVKSNSEIQFDLELNGEPKSIIYTDCYEIYYPIVYFAIAE